MYLIQLSSFQIIRRIVNEIVFSLIERGKNNLNSLRREFWRSIKISDRNSRKSPRICEPMFKYTQRNLFEILFNETEIRLYLTFSD